MADETLPAPARKAAEAAYRNWRIGGQFEGRLHAALEAAAPLIREAERERIAQLAEAWGVIAYEDWDGDGIALGVPFAGLIREPS